MFVTVKSCHKTGQRTPLIFTRPFFSQKSIVPESCRNTRLFNMFLWTCHTQTSHTTFIKNLILQGLTRSGYQHTWNSKTWHTSSKLNIEKHTKWLATPCERKFEMKMADFSCSIYPKKELVSISLKLTFLLTPHSWHFLTLTFSHS